MARAGLEAHHLHRHGSLHYAPLPAHRVLLSDPAPEGARRGGRAPATLWCVVLRPRRRAERTADEHPSCARDRMRRTRPAADDVWALLRQHRTMPETTSCCRLGAGAAIAMVATTAFLLAACGGAVAPPAAVLPPSGSVAAVQKQFTEVVALVSPTVVQIETARGLGSGIVYDADGDVVTNAHVTSGATRFVVTLRNGERHAAKL